MKLAEAFSFSHRQVDPGAQAAGSGGSEKFFFAERLGQFELVIGRSALGPAEELDVFGNDLIALALDPFVVGPLVVVDAAGNRNQHALDGIVGDASAEAVEAGDPVPFGVLGGEAAFVLEGLALEGSAQGLEPVNGTLWLEPGDLTRIRLRFDGARYPSREASHPEHRRNERVEASRFRGEEQPIVSFRHTRFRVGCILLRVTESGHSAYHQSRPAK